MSPSQLRRQERRRQENLNKEAALNNTENNSATLTEKSTTSADSETSAEKPEKSDVELEQVTETFEVVTTKSQHEVQTEEIQGDAPLEIIIVPPKQAETLKYDQCVFSNQTKKGLTQHK